MEPREFAHAGNDILGLLDATGERRIVAFYKKQHAVAALPERGHVVVGRSRDCELRIDIPSLSRHHVRIVVDGAHFVVEDLGSSNGTHVGGRRLATNERVVVEPGTAIAVGGALLLLVAPPTDTAEATGTTTQATATQATVLQGDAAADSRRFPERVPEPKVRAEATPMNAVHQLVDLVARSNLSVILLGETGVGKEVTAARVHAQSVRADKRFVQINCAALSDPLLESELFGHEKGAFTGAVQQKQGLIEAADGGTLFLDELGEMSLTMQAKLLRAVEAGEVTRVGALKPRQVDVRFVAATHRDLDALVTAGSFREDLFFRLNGLTIVIPPLRERRAEVLPFAHSFLVEACARAGRATPRIGPEASAKLLEHTWPGNVRELKNVMARAAVLATGDVVGTEHIIFGRPSVAAVVVTPTSRVEPVTHLPDEDERRRILEALDQCGGNQTEAAARLGISRRTLLNRLDAYKLPRPRKRTE
jgi:transcriptional regulator with PAS, ATPase and Fis domain